MMNEREHFDQPAETLSAETRSELIAYNRIIPRVLRNMMLLSILLLAPAFWFYRWPGSIGFAFGAAVSYVNFRFLVRYGLVGAVAYAIFKGSSLAFRGFLWGLCVPAAALMVEAVWEGYTAFRRTS